MNFSLETGKEKDKNKKERKMRNKKKKKRKKKTYPDRESFHSTFWMALHGSGSPSFVFFAVNDKEKEFQVSLRKSNGLLMNGTRV